MPAQTLGHAGDPWARGGEEAPQGMQGRVGTGRVGLAPRSHIPLGWHWPERTFWRSRPRAAPVRPMIQSLS